MENNTTLANLTSNESPMQVEKQVTKRDGTTQAMSVEKIHARLERLLEGLAHKYINLDIIINKVVSYAQNGTSLTFLFIINYKSHSKLNHYINPTCFLSTYLNNA